MTSTRHFLSAPFRQKRSSVPLHLVLRSSNRLSRLFLVLLLCACTVGVGLVPAHASTGDLEQTLDEDAVSTDTRVVESGHVDLGPKFADGDWQLMGHADEKAAESALWYDADRMVFTVPTAAAMTAPDDEAYDFLGDAVGSQVYVLPQTQDSQLPWLGWNTQDPEVMEQLDRGVTLSMTGLQGPGDVSVFLQSGSFGAPDVLFNSAEKKPQSIWVDVNTHTHANWVFTQPGVYLVELTIQADLIDGRHVADTAQLRFAVGDVSANDAQQAQWKPESSWGRAPSATASDPPGSAAGTDDAGGGSLFVPILIVSAVVLALLIVLAVRTGLRSRRNRDEAFARRTGAGLALGEPHRADDERESSTPADDDEKGRI